MGFFSGYYPVKNKLVIISGGSQGLGAALAKTVVNNGGDVVIVARTVSKLESTVESLEQYRQSPDQLITYVSADLSSPSECANVFTTIKRVPDIVMCCAGVAKPGLLIETEPEVLEGGINSNYKSALYLSHAALRVMGPAPKTQDPRHITFFSSVVAFYSFIGYGSYAPLKTALRSYADILRQECTPYNIKVECVFPGNIDTEGYEEENLTKPSITKDIEGPSPAMKPEECAKLVLQRLDSGQEMVHTDFIGWLLNGLVLGSSPRTWGLLLTIAGFIITLVFPIWNLIVNRDIRNFFTAQEQKKEDEIKSK